MKKYSNYLKSLIFIILISFHFFSASSSGSEPAQGLSLSTFEVDATPPLGYVMPYGTVVRTWDMGLRAKGIVLQGAGKPIVLVAVDWIGIGNEGQMRLKKPLPMLPEQFLRE